MEGKGVEKDEQEAAKWYKKVLDYYTEEALKGDGEKQIEVALFYLEGKGVEKDDKERACTGSNEKRAGGYDSGWILVSL